MIRARLFDLITIKPETRYHTVLPKLITISHFRTEIKSGCLLNISAPITQGDGASIISQWDWRLQNAEPLQKERWVYLSNNQIARGVQILVTLDATNVSFDNSWKEVCFIDVEKSWASGNLLVFCQQKGEIGGIFVMGVGARFWVNYWLLWTSNNSLSNVYPTPTKSSILDDFVISCEINKIYPAQHQWFKKLF